ncbi:phytanoyl-CoA dioxygenase family protein [Haloferula sp. BvORR071]|uniref:phytanoyl-CoA dioxygenase family protein n=1 Tax=Haloferula sp. BvORR071 TaxID=1396141 RepID=UPI0005508D43|nr:phytanoyl-CoA dioxygenase family protein [Haloferula sp. BvORR071]
MVAKDHLQRQGWAIHRSGIAAATLALLRDSIFTPGAAGTRCLLDLPEVQAAARDLRSELVTAGILPSAAVAIQAIAFDKTPDTNWKVAWHQDLMFPFARLVQAAGYDLPSKKDGVDFARPPLPVLEQLLAVRLHLDDCDETNGPLRVSPGSHRQGLIPSRDCSTKAAELGEHPCLAKEGEALLMHPLLLHASSPASRPRHRRVLHLVYHSGEDLPEAWHRKL